MKICIKSLLLALVVPTAIMPLLIRPKQQAIPPQQTLPQASITMPILAHTPHLLIQQVHGTSLEATGENKIIKTFIHENDVVFDLGANLGNWSQYVLSQTKPQIIYAFEPLPDIFQQLQKNLNNLPMLLYNMAMNNMNGECTFYECIAHPGSDQLSSLYDKPYQFATKPLSVTSQTLDHFCQEHQVLHINFLKIDTEGAEYAIFQGAKQLLAHQAIDYIQFEYTATYKNAKATLESVCRLLAQHGYVVFKIFPFGIIHLAKWIPAMEDYQYSNFFAVHPQHATGLNPTQF